MPEPVHITIPIDPMELRIKRLNIPKARQKKLRAMMSESRARRTRLDAVASFTAHGGAVADDAGRQGKNLQSAFSAR